MPDGSDDGGGRDHLASMKRRATGLLLAVTVLFVATVLVARRDATPGWVGYVQAFAEAAMVGALADWFAVTALFRHPLGLAIPHTAIIAERKDQIGASLGTFVQTNFVDADTMGERVLAARPAQRFGVWLAAPDHRERVVAEFCRALVGVSDVVDDDEVSAFIEQALVGRLARLEAAPMAARALEVALADGRDEQVIDAGLGAVIRVLTANRDGLRVSFARQSPWWVPGQVDDRVFDRIHSGAVALLSEIRSDPDHQLRVALGMQLHALVTSLRTDPGVAATAERLKAEVLDHPSVRTWTSSLWLDTKAGLARQAADPTSQLRRRVGEALERAAAALDRDEHLRAKLDDWAVGIVRHLATEHGHEIASLIRTTVERWDAHDTSARIEAQIGPDLQFIRINGTIVGGLAGLVIHTAAQIIG